MPWSRAQSALEFEAIREGRRDEWEGLARPSGGDRPLAFFQQVMTFLMSAGWKERECASAGGDCRVRRSFCSSDLVLSHQWEALGSFGHLVDVGAWGRHP